MKYLLTILLFASFTATAQYIPNSNAYSYKGLMPLKSLQVPTACGDPSTVINSPDSSRSAIYFDSCNARFWRFDPKPKTWAQITGGAGGIDSIFITTTDSIFVISGNDTIFVGIDSAGMIRDTASLNAGWPLTILNPTSPNDSIYKPNGYDVTIVIDSNVLGDYIVQVINGDTTIINNTDSTQAVFVDTLANAPPGGVPDGYRVLVGTSPTGLFAGHANDIAELVGGVWTFTDPILQQQLIVDNVRSYTSYQWNGTQWKVTSILWRVGGNKGVGNNAWIGRGDKVPLYIRSWNKNVIKVDTTRDIYFYKHDYTDYTNVFFKPGLNGLLDTGHFRRPVYSTPVNMDSVVYIDGGAFKYGTATGGGSDQGLQSVTDVGNTTTNSFGILTDNEPVYITVAKEDANNSVSMELNEGARFKYLVNGNAGNLEAENISGTTTWQLPNVSGTLAESVTVNSSTYHADVNGNIDLGTIGGGGGTPAGNYGNLQLNRNNVFETPASDSLSFNSGVLSVKGGLSLTLGSDATGDIYYRNGSGLFTRLGIGSTNQILNVVGGIPAWGATAFLDSLVISRASLGAFSIAAGADGRANIGLRLQNPTAATVGTPVQYSPVQQFSAEALNTTNNTSLPATFTWYLIPASGAYGASPSTGANANLVLRGTSTGSNLVSIAQNGSTVFNGAISNSTGNITATGGVVGAFAQFTATMGSGQVFAGQGSSTTQTYRTTNAGSNITPYIITAFSSVGDPFLTWDKTNQLGFGQRSAATSQQVQAARIFLTDVVTTAGAEAGGLGFATQTAGAVSTEKMRLTASGSLLVGTTTESASAAVKIESTTKGFLPPRMTATQAEAISSPAEGLMIYSTNGTGSTITSKGWWGWDGSAWVKLN